LIKIGRKDLAQEYYLRIAANPAIKKDKEGIEFIKEIRKNDL